MAEQLESIVNQSYPNWRVFIRDDGSKDRTQEIIKDYASRDKRIIFLSEISEENIGVKKSFLSLLLNVDSKYYFFCDQDDVWLPNKIQNTLNLLKKEEVGEIPVCVHTDLEIVDKNLNRIYPSMIESQNLYKEDNLIKLLVQNSVTGCTMALNHKLKEIVLKQPKTENILMHDWWIALVGAAFGKVILLDEQTILYRQHGNNEVGAQSFFSKMKNGYNLEQIISSVAATFVQAQEFLNVYYNLLPDLEKKQVQSYLSVLSSKRHVIFYHKWHRNFKKKGFIKNFVFIFVNMFFNREIKNQVEERISVK